MVRDKQPASPTVFHNVRLRCVCHDYLSSLTVAGGFVVVVQWYTLLRVRVYVDLRPPRVGEVEEITVSLLQSPFVLDRV